MQELRAETTFVCHVSSQEVQRAQLEAVLRSARGGGCEAVRSTDPPIGLRRLMEYLTDQGVRVAFVQQHSAFTGEDQPIASCMLSIMGAVAGLGTSLFRDARWKVSCSRRRAVSV